MCCQFELPSMKAIILLLAVFAGAFAAPNKIALSEVSKSRIVGGLNAPENHFPHQVSFQRCDEFGENCQHSCGGAILNPQVILTAAHCVDILSNYKMKIVAGILNLDDTNEERQDIYVKEFTIHPDYDVNNSSIQSHDIAILHLDGSLRYNSAVKPAKLPPKGSQPTAKGTVSGWGASSTDGMTVPDRLQAVTASIIDISTCREKMEQVLPGAGAHVYDHASLCTYPEEDISTCSGDSGSPLVADNGDVMGVAAWVITPCGTIRAPNVFTKVSYFVDWIHSVI